MSRGPRKLRGAHLESRRLSNLICLWLKETDILTYGLPQLILSAAVAEKSPRILTTGRLNSYSPEKNYFFNPFPGSVEVPVIYGLP